MGYLKRVPEEDMSRFIEVVRNAYPAFGINDTETIGQLADRYNVIQKEDDFTNFYGYYNDQEELIGGMRLHNYQMNFRQQKLKVGGIGLVCVDLLHKKEKVAKQLLEFFLDQCQKNGEHMAFLYPFRPDFYKQMGFGYSSRMDQYKLKPNAFPYYGDKSHLRVLTRDDLEGMRACYETFVDSHHGMMERTPFDWDRMFTRGDLRIIGFEREGQIEGYVTFSFKRAHENNQVINDLCIEEFMYLTREALRELSSFFHTQNDQIRRIVINTQDESFYYLLNDPRNDTDRIIPHVYHEMHTSGMGLMARIVNVEEFFKAIPNHNFNGVTANVRLIIHDSFHIKNESSLIVSFKEGFPVVEPTNHVDATVEMDIAEFSSLVMGAIHFKQLHHLGLVETSDSKWIDTLDRLFSVPSKPICMTGF
jgi:predicted acetyltransferase